MTLAADASYLVTGGLGGFGLKTAQWLVSKGARQLILLSRSGPASEEAQAAIATFEAQGVKVLAAACDITDYDALASVMARVQRELSPLRGIVHAATVIDDGLIRNLDAERIQKVLAPKIDGAGASGCSHPGHPTRLLCALLLGDHAIWQPRTGQLRCRQPLARSLCCPPSRRWSSCYLRPLGGH